MDAPPRMFSGWFRRFENGNLLETYEGNGGWWAILHRPGWRMDRGPYPSEWMAKLEFPIARYRWRGGN